MNANYLERLNFHSALQCSRTQTSIVEVVTRRDVKKRKLIEDCDVYRDAKKDSRESILLALQLIQNEIDRRNPSPSAKTACLAAVKTLDTFLNKI